MRTGHVDGAYGFSFSIALGLVLFIGGLVLSLTLGEGTGAGLIFGIPLIIAGLVIPLFMMRDLFTRNEMTAPCPSCSHPVKFSDATIRLDCPNCGETIAVRDMQLFRLK
jgi:predicted RNA-binding Zn-ribbon protein involved in translation (DUF1610 family)